MRTLIKPILKRLRLDVKRLRPASNFGLQVARIVIDGKFDLVFDIGANYGQFARELRENGYTGRIVSVEPLTHAHTELSRAAADDPAWQVAPRGALGAAPGATVINVSGMHASSSLLTMTNAHEQAAPGSERIGVEQVDVTTFDALFAACQQGAKRVFVKIDTQGFELEVLKGALASLSQVRAMLLELSLVELYAGQPLWTAVIAWLGEHGFELTGLSQAFVDPRSYRTLQVDGIFMRSATA